MIKKTKQQTPEQILKKLWDDVAIESADKDLACCILLATVLVFFKRKLTGNS